jgi:hypothetical protein
VWFARAGALALPSPTQTWHILSRGQPGHDYWGEQRPESNYALPQAYTPGLRRVVAQEIQRRRPPIGLWVVRKDGGRYLHQGLRGWSEMASGLRIGQYN